MTGDEYIQQVLANYAASYGPASPAIQAANAVAPTLTRWAGDQLAQLLASGSYAKRTAIAGGTDIDIFISLKPAAPTLQEIYKSLAQLAKDQGWAPRAQNVSIGIACNGIKIDLVPGRQQQGYKNYHSLWRRKAGTWTQTNIALHIDRVRDSGRTDEIRALKIWPRNHNLDFPSFYLELTVLDALSGCGPNLANNVQRVLNYIAENLETAVVEDPANTNNCISDDLTQAEKKAIAAQARASHNARTWGETLW
jgi:hypothetical protein